MGAACSEHRRAPFTLLLHGGDQIYADEATFDHPLSDGWPGRLPSDPLPQDLDALRDQWQSRAHRESWRRMLRLMLRIQDPPGQDVTILSGEIHLAARATMSAGNGQSLHQRVASGITHRAPPKARARTLHGLAALGEAPMQNHPIKLRRISGQRLRYVAERNYLTLDRIGGELRAIWQFEDRGASGPLPI